MSMDQGTPFIERICKAAPVIPVIVLDDETKAIPLAEALVAGGLPVLEVTLRTPAALDIIKKMTTVEGAIVGAGTLTRPRDVEAAQEAGAVFGVSPGAPGLLTEVCQAYELPLLPGAATATECMSLLHRGYTIQKFFPAEAIGGAKALASLASPLSMIKFCPTGGISPQNAGNYLALDNVLCVGGSWVTPKTLIQNNDWDQITNLARNASAQRFDEAA